MSDNQSPTRRRTRIIDDRELSATIYSPVCTMCWHLRNGAEQTCDAFPDGIPADTWEGCHRHQTPFPGDHGIQFDPR